MLKKWCICHKYSLIFILFLVCFYGYSISRVYGFIFFPDEFGYWTYAAKGAGYDWSEIVSLGSYYSYGYSLILFPIFKLCTDSVTAYRVAVTLNFALIGVAYFLLLFIAQKLWNKKKKKRVALFAAIAVFYPSWLFYAKTTMVETMLMVTFVVICALLYDYLEKNKLSTLVLFVVALVYIHFLHMRAVGILIAGGVTLFVYFMLQNGKAKQLLVAAAMGITVLLGGFLIKEVIQNMFYASAGKNMLGINDYAGQFEKIAYIFTKEGMADLICGLAGKVLYLGLASFGLAYWGMWYAAKEVWKLGRQIRKKEERDVKKLFYLFVILSTIGETLINAIYNIRPIRIDSVTYGRYHEFVLPILMLLGLYEISKTRKPIMGTILVTLIQLPMVPLVLYSVNKYQLTNFHGYIMVGMSYLHNLEEFEPSRFYWTTYVFLAAVSIFVAVIVRIACRKGYEVVLVWLIVLEFLLSARASINYIEDSSRGAYRDTIIVDKIESLQEENPERRVVYIREDDSPFISIIQFMMRDEKITLVTAKEKVEEYTEKEMDENDIILLKFDSLYAEKMTTKYSNYLLHGHFYIFYNP